MRNAARRGPLPQGASPGGFSFYRKGGEAYGDRNRSSLYRCGDGDRQGDEICRIYWSTWDIRFRRVGSYHTTKEMDSLRIKNRRTWFRYSKKTGGDAITFLQRFCDKSFQEAVEYLLAYHGRSRDSPARPRHKPGQRKNPLCSASPLQVRITDVYLPISKKEASHHR